MNSPSKKPKFLALNKYFISFISLKLKISVICQHPVVGNLIFSHGNFFSATQKKYYQYKQKLILI